MVSALGFLHTPLIEAVVVAALITGAVTLRRAYVKTEKARALLAKALRARDDFIAVAAHELRTPVAALALQAEVLARHPERLPHHTVALKRMTTRLARLVDDLLDVSRIREGKLKLEPIRFDLVDMVQQCVQDSADEATHAECKLAFECEHLHVVGVWDRDRVEQALVNLLSNAFKYGRGAPVLLTLRADAQAVLLSVKDCGMGVSPEDLERIFGRFERAETTGCTGVGLGLWIAQSVLEAMGGKILASSKRGLGSTFTIVLPRNPAPEVVLLDNPESTG